LCQAFFQEALDEVAEVERFVKRYLKNNAFYLWQEKVPVSVDGYSGATPNGIRVNFVYTPQQDRGNG
jgi:hypothetical protein